MPQTPCSRVLLLLIAFLLGSCQPLENLLNRIKKPTLNVEDVRVDRFNFSEIGLVYRVRITNPNPVALRMTDYAYSLEINDQSFVEGEQLEGLQVDASASSIVEVPVTVGFRELYETVKGLAEKEESAYRFRSTLAFDLPGLGRTELPVTREGAIPMIRRPDLRIQSLTVENLSLSSADLMLNLAFDNPNGFGLRIDGLQYGLEVNQREWATGEALEDVTIARNATTRLQIPLSLNMAQVGLDAYRLLQGSGSPDYRLSGTFRFNALHELLGRTEFRFDQTGQLPFTF